MAFSEEYFIHVQGEQKGPYTFPQLKRLYDNNLIPEETLYWQDGMEGMQAVSDLCGAGRRERERRLKRLRVAGIAVVGMVVLATAYCAKPLKEVWKEMNDRDQTAEGAYWRARGFVREGATNAGASVGFQPYTSASVVLTGTEALAIVPGTLYGSRGTEEKKVWKVHIVYDTQRREWRLPGH